MQLKHFFVFLLVLVLSVAEFPVYAQEITSNYYQSSKIIQKKKLSIQNTKLGAFNQKKVSGIIFLAIFFPSFFLNNVFQKQILIALKLQKQLYSKIASLHNQHIFLINKISASNSISILYSA